MKPFSTKLEDGGQAVVWAIRPRYSWYPRVGLFHAHKGGAPVLKIESNWRTVAGFLFRVRKTVVWVQFRGFSKW